MNNKDNNSSMDYLYKYDNHISINIKHYESTIPAMLNMGFDRFVQKIGGRVMGFRVTLALFALLMTLIAVTMYTMQQRTRFSWDNGTFSLVSIDRRSGRNIHLHDQQGNELIFTAIPEARTGRNTRFTVIYMGYAIEANIGYSDILTYSFSDGSSGNKSRNQNPTPHITRDGTRLYTPMYLAIQQASAGMYPVGQVPHFNRLQQAESVLMSQLIDFYRNFTEPHYFVLTMLGSMLAWVIWAWFVFYREEIHYATRPFSSIWWAELTDQRIANLQGRASVIMLLIGFVLIGGLTVLLMYVA